MIEKTFREWLIVEMVDDFDRFHLSTALHDDDFALDIWEDFEKYHHQEFIQLVRDQMKSVLNKKGRKYEV